MKRALKVIAALIVLLVAVGVGWLLAASGVGRAADPASLNELERAFAERMQNVALEGHFTVEGRERRDGNPELYEISKVTKLEGDRWRFDVHLTYGNVDATLPVVVPSCGRRTHRWSTSLTSRSLGWGTSSARA